MNPAITCVALDLTTNCDRRCPECCAGVGINRTLQHHDWAYFERAAKVIYGVERLHVGGGEPTFHPQFAEFVPRFRQLFGCKTISMVTDGWGVLKYQDIIAHYIDEVHFTRYGNRPDAEALLHELEASGWLSTLLIFDAGPQMSNFTPRAQIGGGKPCHRAWWLSGQVAYADGRIYGCCVAPGIEGAKFYQQEALIGIVDRAPDPPCERCWFSE